MLVRLGLLWCSVLFVELLFVLYCIARPCLIIGVCVCCCLVLLLCCCGGGAVWCGVVFVVLCAWCDVLCWWVCVGLCCLLLFVWVLFC